MNLYITKLLNNEFYKQNLVRKKKDTILNQKVLTIDSYSDVTNTISQKKLKIGSSINATNKILKNKFNKKLKINTILEKKAINKSKIEYHLKALKEHDQKKTNLVAILKKKRGGFWGISGGFKGFIPRSHYKFTSRLIKFKKVKKSNSDFNSMLKIKNLSKYLPIRLPLTLVRFDFYPAAKKTFFIKNKRVIKKVPTAPNIVFINKKKPKEQIKIYEKKKKVRKYKNKLSSKTKKSFDSKK